MHSYNDHPCSDCGNLDGCHILGKVKRNRSTAQYGQPYPKVVCLCGSTRFGEAYREATRSETLEGNIVLSVGLLGHAEGIDMDGPVKAMLDDLHKRKIDMADEILVLNVIARQCPKCERVLASRVAAETCHCGQDLEAVAREPYIGSSTRREIEYAILMNKRVRWLENPGR